MKYKFQLFNNGPKAHDAESEKGQFPLSCSITFNFFQRKIIRVYMRQTSEFTLDFDLSFAKGMEQES